LTIESGWPASGNVKGSASPSDVNCYIAVKSIIEALEGDVIVFEAFNDYWKNPGSDGVEQSFVLFHLDALMIGLVHKFLSLGANFGYSQVRVLVGNILWGNVAR